MTSTTYFTADGKVINLITLLHLDGIIRIITKREKEGGDINIEIVSSTIGSDYNYAKATLTAINRQNR